MSAPDWRGVTWTTLPLHVNACYKRSGHVYQLVKIGEKDGEVCGYEDEYEEKFSYRDVTLMRTTHPTLEGLSIQLEAKGVALPTTHFILDNTRLKEGLPKSFYLPEQNRWVPLQDVIGFVRIVP